PRLRPRPSIAGERDLAHRKELAFEESFGTPAGARLGCLLTALDLARALAFIAAPGVVRWLLTVLGGLFGDGRGLRLLGDLLHAIAGLLGRGRRVLGDTVLANSAAVGQRQLG